MKRFCRIVAAASASLPFTVQAQSDLEQVVVTATRIEQPISQVIGSVTVITREEIERRQVRSLQDLLRGEAGLSIVNQGGLGKSSTIFLRGANPTHTLILVDGARLGSATAGTTAIESIPVEQIERVEIVRGPRSSLYGSDAIGGVIQIFTRKTQGVSVNAGTGTHDTHQASGAFGINQGALRFNVAAGYLGTAGFNACSGDPINFAGCFVDEPDKDGYRNTSASMQAAYSSEQLQIEFSTLYSHGYSEYDGYSTDFGLTPNQTRFTQSTPTLRLKYLPAEAIAISLAGSITREDTDNFGEGVFASRFDTEKRNASAQSDWQVAEGQTFTLGADYLDDRVNSTTAYDRDSRSNTGIFGQYLGSMGQHEFSASARNDDNEQFGSHVTGNVGWKWFVVDRRFAINAGWGTAFHAPTFNDLYFPFSGNPLLRPETSRSYELGASGALGNAGGNSGWSLQLFSTDAKDLIAYDSVTDSVINVGKARVRGAELSARHRWGNLDLALNYTALDARSRAAGSNFDHHLARRARHSGRIDVGYRIARLQVGSSINLAGPRYDNLANTVRLGGYTTADFTADLMMAEGWSLQARLANAFDRRYETSRFFNQDGRNVFIGVRYQMR